MGFHKKVLTWSPFIEDYVEIDEKIAELITLLWENNIKLAVVVKIEKVEYGYSFSK